MAERNNNINNNLSLIPSSSSSSAPKPIWLKQAEEVKLKSGAQKDAAAKAAFEATFNPQSQHLSLPAPSISDSDSDSDNKRPLGLIEPTRCTAHGAGIAGGTACVAATFTNKKDSSVDGEVDGDSDAPEEFTSQQGMHQNQQLIKVQELNKARVVREVKERRRKWTQKLTQRPKKEISRDEAETETHEDSQRNKEMLPDDIVKILTAREKKVFTSDSENEEVERKSASRKRLLKKNGPVIFKEISHAQCVQNSLEFLKKRKMQVSRSPSVLNNSKQALRLISNSGLLD